jgi:hypothetical protein
MRRLLIAMLLSCDVFAQVACPDFVRLCADGTSCMVVKSSDPRLQEYVKQCEAVGSQQHVKGCLYELLIERDILHIKCGPEMPVMEVSK